MAIRIVIYLVVGLFVIAPSIFLGYGTVKGFRNITSSMDVFMISLLTYITAFLTIFLSELRLINRKQQKAS